MSQDLALLRELVRNSLVNGELTLAFSSLASPAIAALAPFFSAGALHLTAATIDESDASLTVRGSGEGLFAGLTVEARFALSADGTATLSLHAATSASYKLSSAFPALSGTLAEVLIFSGATLVLSSASTPEQAAGLAFSGSLSVREGSGLGRFIPILGAGELTMSGAITLSDGLPMLRLSATTAFSASLGFLQLSQPTVTLTTSLRSTLPGQAPGVRAVLGIDANLTIAAGGQPHTLALSAELTNLNHTLRFTAQPSGGVPASLSEISQLIGGANLSALLPATASSLVDALQLRRLSVQVDLQAAPPRVHFVNLEVASAGTFPFFSNAQGTPVLTAQEIVLRFAIMDPQGQPGLGFFLTGVVGLSDSAALEIAAQYPDFSVAANLRPDAVLSLSELYARLSGSQRSDLPALNVSQLELRADPASRSLAASGTLTGPFDISLGATTLGVTGVEFSFRYADGRPRLSLLGSFAVDDESVELSGEVGEHIVLAATIPELHLTSLIEDLIPGGVLPDEIPELLLTDVALSVTPDTGAFSLGGAAAASFPFGLPGVTASRLEVHIERAPAVMQDGGATPGTITASLALSGTGPFPLADGARIDQFQLRFDFTQGAGWQLSGAVGATVLSTRFSLSASFEQSDTQRTLRLSAHQDRAVPIPGAGAGAELQLTDLSLALTRSKQPGQVRSSAASILSLSASGKLVLPRVLTLAGTLQLDDRPRAVSLVFAAQDAHLTVPIPVPGLTPSPALTLRLSRIGISRMTAAAGSSADAAFAIEAAGSASVTGLPPSAQKLLPDATDATLRFDQAGAAITISRLLSPVLLRLPDIQVAGTTVIVGQALLDASNLRLSFGNDVAVSLDFGIGIPAGLNAIFGSRNGTPVFRLFNTYEAGNDDTVIRFRLDASSVSGLTVRLLTSPLAAVRFHQEGDITVGDADLGPYGALRFQVPVIGYDGASFTAQGGFEQIRPLGLPLLPIKLLLSAAGAQALADSLPASLPLTALRIYDPQRGLLLDELTRVLERLGGAPLPMELTAILAALKQRFDALPDTFKPYLNFEVPTRLAFDIAGSVDGSARIRIDTDGAPLRFLTFQEGPVGPLLQGIELHKLSFGEILGGSLFALQADARIDTFDFLTLGAALALPLDQLPLVPSTRAIHNRITVRDLFMVILYQSPIPIPVPLCFEELGFSYTGLEGATLESHFSLPRPQASASDALRLFGLFQRFFTDRSYLIEPGALPQELDVRFTIGPNYVTLPPYLGGRTLGTTAGLPPQSALAGVAHLLNTVKTLSLNELMQVIPLSVRTGNERIRFGSMDIGVTWLITTPQEFQQGSYQSLSLPQGQIAATLGVLPPDTRSTQGLVTLLRGTWQVAGTLALDTCFALAATRSGLSTGLKSRGTIDNLVDVELSGEVDVMPQSAMPFHFMGQTRLAILGSDILRGDLQITNQMLSISGALDLFSTSAPLRVTAILAGTIGNAGLDLRGAAQVSLASTFTLLGGTAALTHSGLTLSGTWLNQTLSFAARKADGLLQLQAAITLALGTAFRLSGQALLGLGATGSPRFYIHGALSLLGIAATADVGFSDSGFRFAVSGVLFNLFHAMVSASGPSLLDEGSFLIAADMGSDLLDYVKDNATTLIVSAVNDYTQRLAAAQDRVNQTRSYSDSLNAAIDARLRVSPLGAADPQVLSLRALQPAASAALTAAIGFLSSVQQASPVLSSAATFIAQNGQTNLLTVQSASFSSPLSVVKGGQVALALQLRFLNTSRSLMLSLDFNSPLLAVQALADQLAPRVQLTPPHIDTMLIPHADAILVPHGDTILVPHGDTVAVPRIDIYLVPHGDVPGQHADTPRALHSDTPGTHSDVPHADSRTGIAHFDVKHLDTHPIPHGDTYLVPHADFTATPHIDTPGQHFDQAPVPHADTPAVHADTPAGPHLDTAIIPHVDA